MKSSAAADAVREILLSLGGSDHPEDLAFEKTVRKRFQQRFRVMTNDRGLKYFDEILTNKPKRAEIITAVGVEAGQSAEAAPKAGSSDASLACVGEPSLDKNSQLAALEELLARVKRAGEAMTLARASLLEAADEGLVTEGIAALSEPLRGFAAEMERQIHCVNCLSNDIIRKRIILSAMENKRKAEISQLHLQLEPRAPERILTLTIADRFKGTWVDKLRLCILDLERGLIAPK